MIVVYMVKKDVAVSVRGSRSAVYVEAACLGDLGFRTVTKVAYRAVLVRMMKAEKREAPEVEP